MRNGNKYLLVSIFLAINGMSLSLRSGAQTMQAFDSTLQVSLSVKSDTARLAKLIHLKSSSLSPRESIKLNRAILDEALVLKVDTAVAIAYLAIGQGNNTINDYTSALKNYLAALQVAEKINHFKLQANALSKIAWIYKVTGEINGNPKDLDKATEYINKGLAIAVNHQLKQIELGLLSDLAVVYDVKKMHSKAIDTYKTCINKTSPEDKDALLVLRLNLGICYKNSRQFDSALAQYNICLNMSGSSADDFYSMFVVNNMAILYYEMGNYTLSAGMAVDAIHRSYKEDMPAIRLDMYDCLKKTYQKQRNFEMAFVYSEKLSAIRDSIFNKDQSAQLKDMQEKYETDIKDKQIALQVGQLTYNKRLNLILCGGLLALLLLAWGIYANMRKTAKLNRTIILQRDELGKQSNALSVMMKELHHRVKNNLQIVTDLLNLQSLKLTDPEAIVAMQKSQQRVQAMALIHQRLYKTEEITRINMRDYINELSGFLAVSYGFGTHNYTLTVDIEGEWIDIDKALPLGLILNELVTNAFKYAFNGIQNPVLTIGFKNTDEGIVLVVKDNGIGIAPGTWQSTSTNSFGKQLVSALSKQLRAQQKIEIENGTSFTFIIPAHQQ